MARKKATSRKLALEPPVPPLEPSWASVNWHLDDLLRRARDGAPGSQIRTELEVVKAMGQSIKGRHGMSELEDLRELEAQQIKRERAADGREVAERQHAPQRKQE